MLHWRMIFCNQSDGKEEIVIFSKWCTQVKVLYKNAHEIGLWNEDNTIPHGFYVVVPAVGVLNPPR